MTVLFKMALMSQWLCWLEKLNIFTFCVSFRHLRFALLRVSSELILSEILVFAMVRAVALMALLNLMAFVALIAFIALMNL